MAEEGGGPDAEVDEGAGHGVFEAEQRQVDLAQCAAGRTGGAVAAQQGPQVDAAAVTGGVRPGGGEGPAHGSVRQSVGDLGGGPQVTREHRVGVGEAAPMPG